MHNKYIIVISNSNNPQIEFYTYTGTETGMKKKVLEKAQEIAHMIEVDDGICLDAVEYDIKNGYWQVDITSYEQEVDYIITAMIEKEMDSICTLYE